jgi:hypothetical protein
LLRRLRHLVDAAPGARAPEHYDSPDDHNSYRESQQRQQRRHGHGIGRMQAGYGPPAGIWVTLWIDLPQGRQQEEKREQHGECYRDAQHQSYPADVRLDRLLPPVGRLGRSHAPPPAPHHHVHGRDDDDVEHQQDGADR